MVDTRVDSLAKTLWEYHHVNHTLVPADIILILGNHDLLVPERGAELYHQGLAPLVVISGGQGKITRGWSEIEAEVFQKICIDHGVPAEKILLEDKSTNTGDNIRFTKKMLTERGLLPASAILVTKPYMERRAFATVRKIWPEVEVTVTSPQLSYDNYMAQVEDRDLEITMMVGDVQRLEVYPEKGFTIPQDIPGEVWQAYEQLVELGYTRDLLTKDGQSAL